MFRRTIFSAVTIGILAGIVLSISQALAVTPIIYQAEAFEVVAEQTHEHGHGHDSGAQTHADELWVPEDGSERTAYSVLANILAGIGFAAILVSLMSQLQQSGLVRVRAGQGLIWGLAAYLTFFVAPGIGMPPEIPGIESAPLQQRETWWLLAVVCVGLGLLLLAFAPLKLKLAAPLLLVLPYLIKIPHAEGPTFAHADAEVLAALNELHQKFIIASGLSNLLFWLVLGVVSAWMLNRWILVDLKLDGPDRA